MIGQFKNVKELVLATYPKLPVLLPVLWNFSRALLLLKILYNPNQRFSDFENFQKSDTSGSLIFWIFFKKTQEPKVLNKMKEPPNIGIYRQRAESLQSDLISCLFKANFYGVFCMWVVGGIGMTTTVQKLWCFSQPEAISHDGIPNLKRRDKTCTAIAMQGQIHNRTIIIWEVTNHSLNFGAIHHLQLLHYPCYILWRNFTMQQIVLVPQKEFKC